MRGALLWLLGAAAAFVATAGAFLLLANLATQPADPAASLGRLSGPETPHPRPNGIVVLDLDKGRLKGLEPAPNQKLTLSARNAGSKEVADVRVELSVVFPGIPGGDERRTYEEDLGALGPGESAEAEFSFDLSPATREDESGGGRAYLEARAISASQGVTDVKTVVLGP
jgi:hypothetical protein